MKHHLPQHVECAIERALVVARSNENDSPALENRALQPVAIWIEVATQGKRWKGFAHGCCFPDDKHVLRDHLMFGPQRSSEHAAHASNNFVLRRIQHRRSLEFHNRWRQAIVEVPSGFVVNNLISEPRVITGFRGGEFRESQG